MTVAIAPSLAKPPSQVASTDNAATPEEAVPGADFASLLLGQLAAETSRQGLISDNSAAPAATDLADGTTGQPDGAMLLAALGMAPIPQGKLPTRRTRYLSAASKRPLRPTRSTPRQIPRRSNLESCLAVTRSSKAPCQHCPKQRTRRQNLP